MHLDIPAVAAGGVCNPALADAVNTGGFHRSHLDHHLSVDEQSTAAHLFTTNPQGITRATTPIHKMCFMNTLGLRAAFILAAALALSACSGESEAENSAPTREEVAREVGQPLCEDEAGASLKSPGSAVYEWENLVTDGNYGENSIEMPATVDSQNGFGALIRSYVTCTVWVTGDQVTNASARVTKYRPS